MLDTARMVRKAKLEDRVFQVVGILCAVVVLGVLAALLGRLITDGLSRINWQFLTSFPSRHPDKAGIESAIVGSVLVMLVTGFTAIPLGIAAGVYLEEYARKNWFTNLIEINITNLAGVPSIVYGLMALGLFVYTFHFDRSILSAGLTLAFLILPIVIVATREALRAIPQSMREAAFALGASRWQVAWHHLLPYSLGGISTGVIIALSRAIGETAPLVTIGALTFISFLPNYPGKAIEDGDIVVRHAGLFEWVWSPYTVLPIQMFNWVSRPGDDFLRNAAATGLVLMAITLTLNAFAIVVRYRIRRRIKW
jgi:phosphate transport system permease protein